MLRTILTLVPRAGAREEIVARYRESGILDVAVRDAGCLATELQLPVDPAAPLVVTALWARRADHERWSRHAARTSLAARLLPLIVEARTDEYTIVAHAERHDDAPDEFAEARERMVATQVEPRGVFSPAVLAAMRRVHRHRFVSKELASAAYEDHPLPIGSGQTISQPFIVASMTDLLQIRPGDRVLEIGTGCGYQAAVLAEMGARVYSVEIVPELAARARRTLDELGYERVTVVEGDGWRGFPEEAPFDRIVVTAAPERVPEALLEQLAIGGRMVVPVGGETQTLLLIENTEEGIREREIFGVRFVPMVEGPLSGPRER